jgi:hypothetical protein
MLTTPVNLSNESFGRLGANPPWRRAGNVDTGLGMAAKTSPAIAVSSGGLETAFQADTGELWVYTPANAGHRDTGLGMTAGTSPAITD